MKYPLTTIRQRRKELGWRQFDLAQAANLYLSQTSILETGKVKFGKVLRQRVATALGLQEEALFDNKGFPLVVASEAEREIA